VTDHAHHAPPSRQRNILLRPNLLRAAWMAAVFFGIGFGIVVGLRALAGWCAGRLRMLATFRSTRSVST
jgi:hypothetical protein